MKKNPRKYITIGFVALTLAAGYGGYALSQKDTSLTLTENISGLKTGDHLEIKMVEGNEVHLITDEKIKTSDEKHSLTSRNLGSDKGHYNLLYTITSDDYRNTADISLSIDRQTGHIKASAEGLKAESTASLRLNNDTLYENIRSDWSGQTTLSATSEDILNSRDTSICIDIGGFRGGALTICHEAKDPNVINAQFGGFLGGFLGGGGGIQQSLVAPLRQMTQQLSTAMIQQVSVIGTFLDAKHQLETQSLIQRLQARAHKDYHPSEQMCTIGTLVRNLAETESHVKLSKVALNESVRTRELVSGSPSTFNGPRGDRETRKQALQNYHCESYDFGGQLQQLCTQAIPPKDQDADVNFTRTVDLPLTLNIDFRDEAPTDDERNVFYMLHSLFNADSHPYISPSNITDDEEKTAVVNLYQDLRSLSAMRSVARNSMSNIVAQKVAGPVGSHSIATYMQGLMYDFGLEPDEVTAMIGENPSYYAQMELLTKKIYQHPNFFSNLYDKPANVTRIRTAMNALKMMQDRDIYDALVRREMLMSMLLESDIRDEQSRMQKQIRKNRVWE